MYSKILVPMALDHNVSPRTLAIASALKSDDGEIVALHVHEEVQGSVRAYLDKDAVEAGIAQARADMAEKTRGIEGLRTETVVGHTARTIIDYAAEHRIDCIVIGSHNPGLSDYFLGSTASRVVRHAPCAVHVYRSS